MVLQAGEPFNTAVRHVVVARPRRRGAGPALVKMLAHNRALCNERSAWTGCTRFISRTHPRRHQRHSKCAAAAAPSAAAAGNRCHFDTLNIHRGATTEEVKTAFRRLAREWHPDVNSSADASKRFQAIVQAFEVLQDERQRQQYEEARFGTGSKFADDSGGTSGTGQPLEVRAVLHLGFVEAALGAQRSMVLQVCDACTHCLGTGGQQGSHCPPCNMCKGRGEIVRLHPARGRSASGTASAGVSTSTSAEQRSVTSCPICCGRGFRVTTACTCCGGAGLTRQPRRIDFRVPAGVEHGATLRLAGQGSVSRVGGCRSAVSLAVRVRPERGLRRQGLDVHSQLAVPLWDVLLGGTATVRTLRGDACLAIPPGTQHGAVLSLSQAGVHAEGRGRAVRGSHHFQVRVQMPEAQQLTAAQQQLLERLADLQQQRSWQRPP
ncbi:hypothetical protein D9Q98_002283 [Chlorella vulgaris]|uniref:Uncharacterized protein n=1 Tax=Chlorella vulgaris TaxID=3077 RepID=A0A9D4Z042_CHLVU|nr:hypothetical protein D9Q98_002283 [Chlorella vulgaris]